MLAALAPVLAKEHPGFLVHDSYIDCTSVLAEYDEETIRQLYKADIRIYRGVISDVGRTAVQSALAGNKLVPRRLLAVLQASWATPKG